MKKRKKREKQNVFIYGAKGASLKLSEIYVRFPFKMMLCVCLANEKENMEKDIFKVETGHEKHERQFEAFM